MEVTHPEVLRVTPAFCAFRQCASALRKGVHDNGNDFFKKSRRSDEIPTFWSHSWHGGHWKKIMTLVLFYNGRTAVFLSFLTAFVVMPILDALGVFPGFDRGVNGLQFTTWSLLSGGLVASLVVVLWRSRAPVFLDRICISQADQKMKTMAIFSLAGLLKKTDTLLILWDPTWTERLWCLFELAAFIRSRQTRADQVLIVRPTFMGPISIALFLTILAFGLPFTTLPLETCTPDTDCADMFLIPVAGAALLGFVVSYTAVSAFRNYFQHLDVMREQLLTISFDRTRSACCEQQHVDSTGTAFMCDRKIVKECVNVWFGSEEAFEDTLRSQVLDILTHELSENVFTTAWVLSVTSPIMWAFVDLSVSFLSEFGNESSCWKYDAPCFLLEGLSIWLIAAPSNKDFLILLCKLSRRPNKMCLEILKNIAILCLSSSPILTICLLTRQVHGRIVQAGTFLTCMLLLSACWQLSAFAMRSLLKRPGW
eukprot:Skav226224  [mRNA]  locus=scaffold1218:176103:177548:- [translate_table: standard]